MSYDAVARADALTDAGRPEQAIALLAVGLASEPDDVDLLDSLAYAHLKARDFEAVLETAQVLAARDPEYFAPHYYAALAHDELGHRKEALESARTAVALAPDNPHVLATLAITRSRRLWGRRDGMRAAKRAIELAPENAIGYLAAGGVELHAGHHWRAARWFERALEIEPHNSMAQVNVARAQYAAGDLAAAFGGVDGVLRLDPSDADARTTLHEVVYTALVHLLWVVLVVLVTLYLLQEFVRP